MPKPKIPKPRILPTLTGDPLQCQLCGTRAWTGPDCNYCPIYQRQHYAEGIGVATEKQAEFFCVAESPFISGPSAKLTTHQVWVHDVERIVHVAFNECKNKSPARLFTLGGRYTFAVRCESEKPTSKIRDCCIPFFHSELLKYAKDNQPIMVFALGPGVLQSLKIKTGKYSKIMGQFLETKIQGRRVFVFPSMSKRQLVAKSGFYDILKRHIATFLEAVYNLRSNIPVITKSPVEDLSKNYVFPVTLKEVGDLIAEIIQYAPPGKDPDKVPISLDTETNTLYPHREKLKILSLIVSWETGRAASIPIEHPEAPWTFEAIFPYITQLLQCNKPKIFHNAKFDVKVLRRKGWKTKHIKWDTMIAEHLLAEDKRGFYGLKQLTTLMVPAYAGYEDKVQTMVLEQEAPEVAALKLKGAAKKLAKDEGYISIPLKDLNIYGAIDADVTRQIAKIQQDRMEEEDAILLRKRGELQRRDHYFNRVGSPGLRIKGPLTHIMLTRSIPLTRVLTGMELHGMAVNRDYIEDLVIDMDLSMTQAKTELFSMLPTKPFDEPFNPNSVVQLRKVLFGFGYIHPETQQIVSYNGRIPDEDSLKHTKSGALSTDAHFLRMLVTQFDCVFSKELLKYRAAHKARHTFVENIRVLSREDGRMHTHFHIPGTSTGRLCVSKDTVLETDKGSFIISKLDLDKTPNISIRTHRNRYRKIRTVYFKGKEEMYRVELENGATIKVTTNHRFFTPGGFKHLKDLTTGSKIEYFNPPKPHARDDSDCRKCIRTTLSAGKVVCSRTTSTRDIASHSCRFGTFLPAQIYTRNNGQKLLQLFSQCPGKPTWEKRISRQGNSKRNITTSLRKRIQCPQHSNSVGRKFMVCSPKYADTRAGKKWQITESHDRLRFGILKRTRTIFSRANSNGYSLLRRPPAILRKAVPRILSPNRIDLVCEKSNRQHLALGKQGKSSQKSSLLEFKSARNDAFNGATCCKYPTHASSEISQELPCRLWIPRHLFVSRSRWVNSQQRRCAGQRPEETTGSLSLGLSSSSVHSETSRIQRKQGSEPNPFETVRIKAIYPIGIQEVWDLEVEEDHSYVAQGFVNHNSSSEENMQNIPSRIGLHNIKKIFVPTDRENMVIANADAKAAEVRVYAAYSRDKNLIQALNDGMDPHSFFSAMTLNPATILAGVEPSRRKTVLDTIGIDDCHAWTYEDFENRGEFKTDPWYGKQLDKLRSNIKRVVFGILYGATDKKIAAITGISLEQARGIISSLFKMFPTLPEYIKITEDQVDLLGVVETFTGRRRRFDRMGMTKYAQGKAKRQAVNFKIQSTSSDIVLDVLCQVDEPIKHDFGGQLLITVHDSIVAEVPKKYIPQLPDFFKQYGTDYVAKKYPWMPVPFKWDVEVGPSYGELRSVMHYIQEHAVEEPSEFDFVEQEIREDFTNLGDEFTKVA